MSAPIELAPTRGATTRRVLTSVRHGAGRLHVVLARTIVLAVFAPVYLIGSYIFSAGQSALDMSLSAATSRMDAVGDQSVRARTRPPVGW